jgi:hypothetical protein
MAFSVPSEAMLSQKFYQLPREGQDDVWCFVPGFREVLGV